MLKLNPYSVDDLLSAHRLMMQDLIKEAGKFRSGAVGVYAVIHDMLQKYEESDQDVAPQIRRLLEVMGNRAMSATELD